VDGTRQTPTGWTQIAAARPIQRSTQFIGSIWDAGVDICGGNRKNVATVEAARMPRILSNPERRAAQSRPMSSRRQTLEFGPGAARAPSGAPHQHSVI